MQIQYLTQYTYGTILIYIMLSDFSRQGKFYGKWMPMNGYLLSIQNDFCPWLILFPPIELRRMIEFILSRENCMSC